MTFQNDMFVVSRLVEMTFNVLSIDTITTRTSTLPSILDRDLSLLSGFFILFLHALLSFDTQFESRPMHFHFPLLGRHGLCF